MNEKEGGKFSECVPVWGLQHNVGGVYITSGEYEAIKNWIWKNGNN